MRAHPRFSYLGWALAYGQIALSHLELGDVERALSICEQAYCMLDDDHRQYVVTHSTLEAAYAAALIASDSRERGQDMFQALIERMQASGEHAPAILMHEYRVKAARLVGDGPAVCAALKEMRHAALGSGNPNAILLADSVSQLRARAQSSPLPPVNNKLHEPEMVSSARADQTVVTEFLLAEQQFQRRAQHALHMLGQYASSGEAYLFWFKHGVLELEASLDRREPPEALRCALAAAAANEQTLALPQEPERIYSVLRLTDGNDSCLGIAAIRGIAPEHALPDALVADIGRALAQSAR